MPGPTQLHEEVPPAAQPIATAPRGAQLDPDAQPTDHGSAPFRSVDDDATGPGGVAGGHWPSLAWEWTIHFARLIAPKLGFARSSVFLGFVLAVASWPVTAPALVPQSGLDPSWRAALILALEHRLQFGSQVVFTYGPLGFLSGTQIYAGAESVLALLYLAATMTMTFAVLVRALRGVAPLLAAVTVAFVVGSVAIHVYNGPELGLALSFVGCVYLLSGHPTDAQQRRMWLILGGALSLFGLVKVGMGVAILGALVITIAFTDWGRLRAIGLVLTGAVPVFVVGWFATGNGVGNVVAFVRSSMQIVGGYSQAMNIETPARADEYWLALACAAIVLACAVGHVRRSARRTQVAVLLLTMFVLWILFKEGFVRHDLHDTIFFALIPLLLAAFTPSTRTPAWSMTALLVATVILIDAAGSFPVESMSPVQAAKNFKHQLATTVLSGRRSALTAGARTSMRASYGLPDTMLSALKGKTVAVDPWEQSIFWAYPSLHYDPLPVMQDYSGYTTPLDSLDANALRGPRAPTYLLRQPGAVDGRVPAFDPPAAQLALQCHYVEVAATPTWQLTKNNGNRCSGPMRAGTTAASFGQSFAVPTPPAGTAMVASFHLSEPASWKALDLLWRSPRISIVVTDATGATQTYRFIGGTAADLHVVVPATTLGYSPPFTPPSMARIKFVAAGPSGAGVVAHFYTVGMAATAGTSP
jgi:hypothetical protein